MANTNVCCVITTIALVGILFLCLYKCPIRDNFSMVSGYKYDDGCFSMPVPENIRKINRSPPFYDINGRRSELCSYKNFTFPPPMNYPPLDECTDFNRRYRYWNTGVLSHPQTSFLV